MKAAMKSRKTQIGLAGVLSASLALGVGTVPAHGSTDTTSQQNAPAEANSSELDGDAQIDIDALSESGFEASLAEGEFAQQQDGSVTILDDNGDEVAVLDTELPLQSGDTASVEYTLEGNDEVEANFSTEVGQDDILLPAQPQNVDCASSALLLAGAGVATLGAAMTAPATAGGSLVVADAALGYTGTTIPFARDCYGS